MRRAKQVHLLVAAEKKPLIIRQRRVNHIRMGENHGMKTNREFSHVTL